MFKTWPMKDHVAAISCGIHGDAVVLDLDYEEDSTAGTDANFVMTGSGGIVEVQGTAEGEPFPGSALSRTHGARPQGHRRTGGPAEGGDCVIKARHILETVLYAEDLSAARRFYGEVLGLPVYQEVDGRLVFFRCAGQMLLVFNPKLSSSQSSRQGPPAHGTKGNGHVCFRSTVEELKDWQKHFEAQGIAIERIVDWPDGGRSLYIRDPAGNSVEFAESRIWHLPELKTLRESEDSCGHA